MESADLMGGGGEVGSPCRIWSDAQHGQSMCSPWGAGEEDRGHKVPSARWVLSVASANCHLEVQEASAGVPEPREQLPTVPRCVLPGAHMGASGPCLRLGCLVWGL